MLLSRLPALKVARKCENSQAVMRVVDGIGIALSAACNLPRESPNETNFCVSGVGSIVERMRSVPAAGSSDGAGVFAADQRPAANRQRP